MIGAGIAGLSAAWLLSRAHEVTVYEAEPRIGGHSHTVDVDGVPVDTGFIVYNAANYPNLVALFDHLGVATSATDMSFAVSLDDGALEYGSTGLKALLAQPANALKPRFWAMLRDLRRFYGAAAAGAPDGVTLGAYLAAGRYSAAFVDDHLLPQLAAIWSASTGDARAMPAAALLRFFVNHELASLGRRQPWRTVTGGSRAYVAKLAAPLGGRIRAGCAVARLERDGGGVTVIDADGAGDRFDAAVLATHADTALALLGQPSADERRLLGAFRYATNEAVLHGDTVLMPRRRAAWSAWNHLGTRGDPASDCVTYWMNLLQPLGNAPPLFLTLNPCRAPAPATVRHRQRFDHPQFDLAALVAQRDLWSLQGVRRTWFAGAHFGAGFHEDALQAGLAVAEALGGVRRPWTVAAASGRIFTGTPLARAA